MAERIAVTRRIPGPALELLSAGGDVDLSPHDRPLSADELSELVQGAGAIVTMLHDRVDAALLDAAGPRLRVVANVAVGYDNIDVAEAQRRKIVVTNTPGVLTDATADLALGLLLALSRRIGEGERLIRAGRPWSWDMNFMLGTGLQCKTLGIVGLGAIGQAVARRARAFGMNIAYSSRRRVDPAIEAELDLVHRSVNDLLRESDVVSLHCPLTPDTRHLLDARRLALMKPTALLINTARGAIVDEAALVEALARGCPAGAALDVYEREPAVDSGLVERDDVVLLPHLGSATVETRAAMGKLAAENVVAVLGGRTPRNPVD